MNRSILNEERARWWPRTERRREYTKKGRDNDTLRILMSSRFNRTLNDKCGWFACRGNANKYLAITRWLVRFPTPTYIRSWCLCVVTRLLACLTHSLAYIQL